MLLHILAEEREVGELVFVCQLFDWDVGEHEVELDEVDGMTIDDVESRSGCLCLDNFRQMLGRDA